MKSTVRRFFETLFPKLDGEFIEFRVFQKSKKSGPKQIYYGSIEGLPFDVLEKLSQGWSIYFGVCPRFEKRGDKAAVKHVKSLWCDVDGKDFKGGKEEALRVIKDFSLKPTMIVDSGRGYHCYWVLENYFDINSQEEIDEIEGYLRGLAHELNGDMAAAEIARILRVPGTLNHKEDPSLNVDVVDIDDSRLYTLDDFNDILPEVPKENKKKSSEKSKGWLSEVLSELKDTKQNRNVAFTKVIGKLHKQKMDVVDIETLLIPHAERCDYPLDELRLQIRGVCSRYTNDNTVEDVGVDFSGILPQKDFPLHVFPEKYQCFFKNCAESFSIPVEVVGAMALTIISGMLGNYINVHVRQCWIESIFIWLDVIGRSGNGKSPCMSYLCKPIDDMYKVIYREYKSQLDVYEKNKKKDPNLKKPECQRLLVKDTTVEAFYSAMQSSPKGFLMLYDELSGFIKSHNQYKGGKGSDSSKYLELFDGKSISIERKGAEPIYIEKTGCSILGGTQPMVLKNTFDENSLVTGLFPRFLHVVIPDTPRKISDKELSENEFYQVWYNCLKECVGYQYKETLDGSYKSVGLSFTPDAWVLFKERTNDLYAKGNCLPDDVYIFIPKLVTYSIRFSGLLHCLHKGLIDTNITLETVKDALDLMDFFAGNIVPIIERYKSSSTTSTDSADKPVLLALMNLASEVKNGRLKLGDIQEYIKKVSPEGFELSCKKIQVVLHNIGLETKQSGGFSHLIWDKKKIDRVLKISLGTSTTSTGDHNG